MFVVTDLWKNTHPGARVGYMILNNVVNPEQCDVLEQRKRNLETELRSKFVSKEELAGHFPMPIYSDYYKRHKKTYHVLQQLESVGFKGKSIPCVAGLVEGMFMAELKSGLLTAGHDIEALTFPLTLDAAKGNEKYVLINGKEQVVKGGDMMIADCEGIISSVLCGPDYRTRIIPSTRKAIFIVYALRGISEAAVADHFSDIYANAKVIGSQATIEQQGILG